MAKMFYTLDETKQTLGKNEEEIKQFTREGKLREFRDGPRLMFKADQVDALRSSVTGDAINLGPSDSGSPIGLADSKGGSGISLSEISGSGLGSGIGSGAAGGGSGMMNLKDDTALAADLGLSGSMGGVPSPARGGAQSGTGLSGTSTGSRVGINVFGDESPEKIDPMAQTSVSPAMNSGVDLSLDAIGSGSGLLDLTRESDDTSLGSVLDEINPGARKASAGGGGMNVPEVDDMPEPRGGVVRSAMPVAMERPDPLAPAFGGAALGAAAVVLFGVFALMASVIGSWPQVIKDLYEMGKTSMIMIGAIALVVPVVFFFVGLILGKIAR